ncbi:MAG: hypothetical protein ING00_15800, partial [Roseomonas sp.]|nr:hypothetical protein [Roseomonas sp.]
MGKPYLFKRGSRWYSRIRVPQDLRPFLGEQIVQTLRTENFHLARKKITQKLEKVAILWDELRIVRRQHPWDQIGDLSNGGFLAHHNPKESEDEPEILRPTH